MADGKRIADVPGLAEGTWISLVLRDGGLLPVRGDTVLEAGDDVLVLIDEEQDPAVVCALFDR